MPAARKKIAIACQGAGSHAAFAAGILRRLLAPELRERYTLVGLSGSSGGAVCAALAWAGLQRGGADEARARLEGYWHGMKAGEPLHALVAKHVRLAALSRAQRERFAVKLLVGGAAAPGGERVVLGGHQLDDRRLAVSAGMPWRLVRAERGGRPWDEQLVTAQPPVREFTDTTLLPDPPDEIWIVRSSLPRRTPGAAATPDVDHPCQDRPATPGARLYSLDAFRKPAWRRIRSCAKVRWDDGPLEVKIVEMPTAELDLASMFDRSPRFIDRLIAMGMSEAQRFLDDDAWPANPPVPAGLGHDA